MHGRPREEPGDNELDANAVVSYNLRAIRERRGWTQLAVAQRLGRLSGHQLPQASISAMEGGFDGPRRRRFDAHELYLLAEVFAVPIAYFFLPPPPVTTVGRVLADTARPTSDLYAAFVGSDTAVAALDERLAAAGDLQREEALGVVHGSESTGSRWTADYRTWRDRRLRCLAGRWAVPLVDAAAVMSSLAEELRGLGPETFLADGADGSDEAQRLARD